MKNNFPIIAAVDFSLSSSQVLVHAAKLAVASGRDLAAVHVISDSRRRDWEETMGEQAAIAGQVRDATQRLKDLVAESCGDIQASVTVRLGRPFQILRDVVNELGADLLVLGAHDVARQRLGAVAAHCARSIPADVLILRDWQAPRIGSIAACVDFSRSSAAGLDRAIEIAKIHQASLEIVHVMFPPSRDPWGRVLEQRMDDEENYECAVREKVHARMETFLEPFAQRLADIESNKLLIEGESPAAAIAAHVRTEKVDLTVIGSHAGSWVEAFVLGSNTERLIQDSTSSVLIARAQKS